MEFEFTAKIWYWRGPSPFYFVTVPPEESGQLKAISTLVTYGWGMIPASVRIGRTTWTTFLFEKNGGYIVPLKAAIRSAEKIAEGDEVSLRLEVRL